MLVGDVDLGREHALEIAARPFLWRLLLAVPRYHDFLLSGDKKVKLPCLFALGVAAAGDLALMLPLVHAQVAACAVRAELLVGHVLARTGAAHVGYLEGHATLLKEALGAV